MGNGEEDNSEKRETRRRLIYCILLGPQEKSVGSDARVRGDAMGVSGVSMV